MKLDIKKMDIDSLDELIAKCEDAMVHPFKKKEVALEVGPEEALEQEEEKPDLSEMDMDELLQLYEEMKQAKE